MQIGESTDPLEIVNSLNQYFANIGSELSADISPSITTAALDDCLRCVGAQALLC